MKIPNIIGAIVVLLIAGLFYSLSYDFPKLAMQETGPAFMPRIYSGLLVLLGGILLVQGLMDKSKKENGENTMVYALIAMGIVFVYLIAIPFIGFYISTVFFILALLLFSKVRKKIILGSISIGTVLFIYIFFEKLLKVAIPTGSLFS